MSFSKYLRIVGWFAAFSCLSPAVSSCVRHGPISLTTSSPDGSYFVEVRGFLEAPTNPFVGHVVTFTAYHHGTPVAGDELYIADDLDPGFKTKYPQHDWPLKNALRFLAPEQKRNAIPQSVLVTNTSAVVASSVILNAVDLVVVFNLAPGETASFNTARFEDVNVIARFVGEKKPTRLWQRLDDLGFPTRAIVVSVATGNITLSNRGAIDK